MRKFFKTTNLLFLFVTLCCFLLLSGLSAQAADYYVSPTGDDSANGGVDDPWKTVSNALTVVAQGDTIKLYPGTYDMSKESGGYIKVRYVSNLTITAVDPQDRPILISPSTTEYVIRVYSTSPYTTISHLVLDNSVRTSGWHVNIWVDEADFVTVDNCELKNGYTGVGGQLVKGLTVRNCVAYNMGSSGKTPETGNGGGFFLIGGNTSTNWDEKILIENNEVYNCGGDGFFTNSNFSSREIYNYIEVRNNNFHHNEEDGIDLKDANNMLIHDNELHDNWADGIVTHGEIPSTSVEFYNNKVYNNGWWGVQISANCEGWKIFNNLIYNNASDLTYDYYYTSGISNETDGNIIAHNVFYNNGTTDGIKKHGGITGTGTIVNNVFYNNPGEFGNIQESVTGDIYNNFVYPDSLGQTGTDAIISSDPGFKDAANGKFTLEETSVLRDAAVDIGITFDHDNLTRPYLDSSIDIGPFEYTPIPKATLQGIKLQKF